MKEGKPVHDWELEERIIPSDKVNDRDMMKYLMTNTMWPMSWKRGEQRALLNVYLGHGCIT